MSSCLATACQLLHQTQWLQECQTEPPGGVAGMDRVSYEVLGNTLGNRSEDVVEPLPSKVFPFVFLIALLGIFMLVNLRRTLIVDIRLPWPSSTATGTSHSTRIGYMPCALHDFCPLWTWQVCCPAQSSYRRPGMLLLAVLQHLASSSSCSRSQ